MYFLGFQLSRIADRQHLEQVFLWQVTYHWEHQRGERYENGTAHSDLHLHGVKLVVVVVVGAVRLQWSLIR